MGGLSSIELKMADALPITMTLGGLKEGIAQEIEQQHETKNFQSVLRTSQYGRS